MRCYNRPMQRARVALNAHLLSGEAGYRKAGIHQYLYNTLACLPDVDRTLGYTVFAGAGHLPERTDWLVRRSRMRTAHPVMRIVWEQLVAPFELTHLQADLFHGMAFVLPLIWNGSSVVTIFDLSFIQYPERLTSLRRTYLTLFTRASVRRAKRIITISESSKAEIIRWLHVPESRIDVALPGVSDNFRPRDKSEILRCKSQFGFPDRFILYLGTLEPRKNLETLVRAYARLRHRGEVKLVLAGAVGWQTSSLWRIIENLDLHKDVVFPGYVAPEDLPALYSAAEIFVYPSVYEGFGLPVLEAMACGLPVVASNATSMPEVVGTAGLLVEPTELDNWVITLDRLLADIDLQAQLSRMGQARAIGFTWEKTAHSTVAAYNKILSHEKHQ